MFFEEYEFFLEEIRQILEKVGGLKFFFLGCFRFVVIDNCIVLKKVVLRFKKKRKKKNIKIKVEEILKIGEYLRVKLLLNVIIREFKLDVKFKLVFDLFLVLVFEDLQFKFVFGDFFKLVCEVEELKLVFDNFFRLVFEYEKFRGVFFDFVKLVFEDVSFE